MPYRIKLEKIGQKDIGKPNISIPPADVKKSCTIPLETRTNSKFHAGQKGYGHDSREVQNKAVQKPTTNLTKRFKTHYGPLNLSGKRPEPIRDISITEFLSKIWQYTGEKIYESYSRRLFNNLTQSR